MTSRILAESEGAVWDAWLSNVVGANAKQTSAYRRALSLYGYTSEILVTEEDGRIRGGALLAARRPGLIVGPLVRASGGLAVEDGADATRLDGLLEAMLDRAREARATRIDVGARIPLQIGDGPDPGAAAFESVLRRHGFEAFEPLATYLVDLAHDSEEALLESFGKNPRRHIRKAMREGMVVERTVDERDFVAFGEAHRSMTARKRLDALPDGFATEVMLPLARAGQGDLFVARYRDVPRNYLFLGTTRDPIYHWGALTEAAKEEGCPQTGQILHYAAMCHYRRLGKPVYDFGGSPGPVPEPTHPNFTVWKFKHEFNGRYVRYLGQWRRTLRPVDSALLEVVRRGMTLRRRLAGR